MGMVGEACLPSNAYYPRTPDYVLYSRVHVCWSKHSDSSFVYGFMSLDYGLGTMTATTFDLLDPHITLPVEALLSIQSTNCWKLEQSVPFKCVLVAFSRFFLLWCLLKHQHSSLFPLMWYQLKHYDSFGPHIVLSTDTLGWRFGINKIDLNPR